MPVLVIDVLHADAVFQVIVFCVVPGAVKFDSKDWNIFLRDYNVEMRFKA